MPDPDFDTIFLNGQMDRIRAGDRDAQEKLIRAVARRMERLARKMLRSFPNVRGEADTADVLQGACMRLLTALRSLWPPSTREFFALAALQMRRELLDLARQVSRRKTVRLGEAVEVAELADGDLELWCGFHQAVDGLPAEHREVVGLVFYHGWTQQQVAELLGICERTVRRHWVVASARLHTILGGRLPPAES
jgi:RNA polymerase sigma factor (sigma-70 family)